jgi:flagellar motor switch protein FliG
MEAEIKKTHVECQMKEEWALLKQWMKTHEKSHASESSKVLKTFQTYAISQTEINNSHQQLISKIMHRIYGNSEDGLITDLKLNKQSAASEIKRVEDSLGRIWWAFGIMSAAMIGNLIKNLFF